MIELDNYNDNFAQIRVVGVGGGGNGEPYFVIRKDVEKNILWVNQGECPLLYSRALTVEKFNFIPKALPI